MGVLHHPTTIKRGYQPVVHARTVRHARTSAVPVPALPRVSVAWYSYNIQRRKYKRDWGREKGTVRRRRREADASEEGGARGGGAGRDAARDVIFSSFLLR